MQISIENVQQRKDPYQLFLDSFKSLQLILSSRHQEVRKN